MIIDVVKKGTADYSAEIRIIDAADGTPETGVEHNTAGIDLYYHRQGAAVTSITEAALADLTTAHTDGGIEHVGGGNYRLDLPDAAVASGVDYVDIGGTITDMIVIGGRIRLTDVDLQDATRMGVTALPNANAGAASGLHILGTNAAAVAYTAGMTISNASGDALALTSSGGNGTGLIATGNGTGEGITGQGGATGHGFLAQGGATSGAGFRANAQSGNSIGIYGTGDGSGPGIRGLAGATGAGISGVGGSSFGPGIDAAATASDSDGIRGTASGAGSGLMVVGGATGHGIEAMGGTNGDGIKATLGGTGVDIRGNITGIVDANVKKINDATVTGDGNATPWDGA